MYRFFNSHIAAEDSVIHLNPSESHHARNVLRLRAGERVRVLNGKGLEITGILEFKGGRDAFVTTQSVRYVEKPTKSCILAFAATENRDTDALIVRSAVEIGVTEISVLITRYSGFRESGDKAKFMERRYKIMVGACKQSGRLWLPEIKGPMKLENFFAHLPNTISAFVGWEPELGLLSNRVSTQKPTDGFAWIVGPEGGWGPEDISVLNAGGATFIRLGSSTLTSPVAAIAGLAALKTSFEDWRPLQSEHGTA